jgi:serine/threonine protein kinase
MAVACPYCRHEVPQKKASPGMYTTSCPACARKFYLAIPEDPRQSPVAAPIPAERDQSKRAAAGQGGKAASPIGGAALEATHADAPIAMTLPGQGRSTSTPGEPAAPTEPGFLGPAPAIEQTRPVWSALSAGSLSRLVGGYLVLRELSRAPMGPVYLARRLWQNRDVTLHTMKPLWARNAPFVARFTREAYGAAQLVHPNLTRIVDLGEAKGTTYVCTEWVDGQDLGAMTAQAKRLEPGEAVTYVLQAARGLKYAHDQSLFHRDIKPENLLVDGCGLVKVANLGLVNTPELAEMAEAIAAGKALSAAAIPASAGDAASGMSLPALAETAVGTAAYMAPEQARDPARIDKRADIYSLGCTLYFLVTGRPPFEGRSVADVMSKHQAQSAKPPNQVVNEIPGALAAIILKMMATQPEARFAHLGEVIDALEGFLGIRNLGSFTPPSEDVELFDQCARTFHESPSARMRSKLVPAILGTCLALAILCFLTGRLVGAGVFATLGCFTAVADFVITGVRRQSPLFQKVAELVSLLSLSEWLTFAAAITIVSGLLIFVKLFWLWLGLLLLGVGIAVALDASFGRHAEMERRESLAAASALLRAIRLQGRDEDTVRQFASEYGGVHWEELFEAIFGYEAKREARPRWGRGSGGAGRPKFAPWRDPIAAWLDARIAARRDESLAETFQKIEERNLHSLGENLMTARRKSKRSARAMVATAADIRESLQTLDGTIMVNRSVAWAMREAAIKPEKVLLEHEHGLIAAPDEERSSLVRRICTTLLSPKVRFLAGAALLAGCIAWMHQNAMISAEDAISLVEAARTGDVEGIQSHAEAGVAHAREVAAQRTDPLSLPGVPLSILALVSSFGAGAGGLILIVSAVFGGVRIALFAIPAAAIPVFLPRLWHPALGGLDPSFVPSIIGAGILLAGALLDRR